MQKQWAVKGQIWNGIEMVGRGKPIVILHGWGRSSSEWKVFGQELHQRVGRTVYCLDLPGFGQSPQPQIGSIEDYANLLVGWMDYQKFKQIDLVGHSLGGRVGIVLGATRPKKIGKLVLIDPAGVKTWSARRALFKMAARVLGWIPISQKRKMVAGLMDEDYRNNPTLRSLYRAVVKTDLRSYLSDIQCQTTVIWGERDPILSLSLIKIYRQKVPRVKIRVVWEAGHDPHLTHPRETFRILEEVWI